MADAEPAIKKDLHILEGSHPGMGGDQRQDTKERVRTVVREIGGCANNPHSWAP